MKRKFNLSLVVGYIFSLKYLPIIICRIKNWVDFVLNYAGLAGLNGGGGTYVFRNGLKIKTKDTISSSTIAVIFIKKDYGNVSDNSVIIDIGANIGVYSIFAAQSEDTVVYAYEPMSDNFDLLKENIKINKLENRIFPFNFGIAARKERRKLYLGESPFHSFLSVEESPFNALYNNIKESQRQKYLEINCVSLKDVFDENKIVSCDILKIDCEGAEYEILYNLPQSYFSRIKKIKLEYHNHKDNIKNSGDHLIKFLTENGFELEKKKEGSPYQGDLWFGRIQKT